MLGGLCRFQFRLSTDSFPAVPVILSVNGTSISGTIQDSFEPFMKLEFVDLSNNALSGDLPASLFDVPSLQLLYLNGNQLTGGIPSNYGNPPLLRDLYLYQNNLVGTIPAVAPGQLDVLTELLLEENDLVGTMPDSICALRGLEEDMDLARLTADCAGAVPMVECDCCTACGTQ